MKIYQKSILLAGILFFIVLPQDLVAQKAEGREIQREKEIDKREAIEREVKERGTKEVRDREPSREQTREPGNLGRILIQTLKPSEISPDQDRVPQKPKPTPKAAPKPRPAPKAAPKPRPARKEVVGRSGRDPR